MILVIGHVFAYWQAVFGYWILIKPFFETILKSRFKNMESYIDSMSLKSKLIAG